MFCLHFVDLAFKCMPLVTVLSLVPPNAMWRKTRESWILPLSSLSWGAGGKEDTFRKVFPFMANEPWEIEWPIRLGGSLLHHLFKYPLLLKNLVSKDLCCRKTFSNNLYCLQNLVFNDFCCRKTFSNNFRSKILSFFIFVAGKPFQITFIVWKPKCSMR